MNQSQILQEKNPPLIQTSDTPPYLTDVLKHLGDLKLNHWSKAMMQDWLVLKPADQQLVSSLLTKWVDTELAERHSNGIRRRIHEAKFIRTQTVDQYDFDFNPSTRALRNDFLKLHRETVEGKVPCAVLVGSTGLGKTHLARALGYAACQANQSVLFIRASQIVNDLATAKAIHNLEREIRKYRKPTLLIADELGYVSMDTEAGNLFFQVISDRHDRGLGTIVTTNYAFGLWNQIFASESTALVIVERLTANAEVFYLEGESYPQVQRKKKIQKK